MKINKITKKLSKLNILKDFANVLTSPLGDEHEYASNEEYTVTKSSSIQLVVK